MESLFIEEAITNGHFRVWINPVTWNYLFQHRSEMLRYVMNKNGLAKGNVATCGKTDIYVSPAIPWGFVSYADAPTRRSLRAYVTGSYYITRF